MISTSRCARIESLERRTLLSATIDHGDGLAVQADGRYVVVGSSSPDGAADWRRIALARYNADGSLDGSFGAGGKVLLPFASPAFATDVAIAPGGKIVIAGQVGGDFAVARLHPSGVLDFTFDGDGLQRIDFGPGNVDEAEGVAVQTDGKVVVAGTTRSADGTASAAALARLNADGSLDDTFGTNGRVERPLVSGSGIGFVAAHDVVIDGDGKAVVAGRWGNVGGIGASNKFAVARFLPDGRRDNSFSGDGIVETAFTLPQAEAFGVTIGPDGKIVATGVGGGDTLGAGVVAATYLSDGSPDPFFDGDGRMELGGFTGDRGMAVVVQPDLKVVVSGVYSRFNGGPPYPHDAAVVRFNPWGGIDTLWGWGEGNHGPPGEAADVALLSDGRIVAAGTASAGADGTSDFWIGRFTAPGQPGITFNGSGSRTTDFGDTTIDTVAPRLVSASSSKDHGASANYSIRLSVDPAATATVEPRRGGPTDLQLVFSEPLRPLDGTWDASEIAVTNARLVGVRVPVNTAVFMVLLELADVVDRSTVTVTVRDVVDAAGIPPVATPGPTLRVRSLFGDVDQDGRVDAMDVRRVLAARAPGSNMRSTFPADVDLSGAVGVLDLLAVRRNLGHGVLNDA